ncbi:hypothetical protein BFR04_13395 [Gaetbulibacter sp. 4G1]|nr:ABC transporter permease [Gaetbulibacter sp. 4G1]PIA81723.1 hypothetical protein BFR04_13395 [Gaetbulibacter sp. 4G1]
MLRNYFKIAWRSLIKNKLYSVINLTGLTIGMVCFILIALYIQFELSYEAHHEKADRIYNIVQQQKGNDYRGTDLFAVAPMPMRNALKEDFQEVEAVTNVNIRGSLLIHNDKSFSERGLYTDEDFFNVFTVPVIEGIGKEALKDPDIILLTESLAKKIFGNAPPLNQTIVLNSLQSLTVKGIIADTPKNQHFDYDYIVSNKLSSTFLADENNWSSNNYHSYLLLSKGADYKNLEANLSIYDKFTKPIYESVGLKFFPQFFLRPLKNIHLYSNMNVEMSQNGDIKYVYLFGLIGLIIIVLASINYMNLATSKSAERAKEVGVSKVLGARKGHLIMQFLGESFLFTLFSFLIALCLSLLLLPAYNVLLGKDIPFTILGSWWVLVGMLLIALLLGVLSGLYPALFLSGVSPVKALKGNFLKNHKKGELLRNSLVIGQFVVAIALAIGSVIIHQQLGFIQNKKLGYNKDMVVHVPYWEKQISEKEEVIKAELLNHSKIDKVSISTQIPLDLTSQGPVREWEGNVDNKEMWIYRSYVDYNFMELFEMELIEGRGFSREFATDSSEAYILNESAVKKLGWKTAVGKKFDDGRVIGVIKDFHLQTFDFAIEPLYMTLRRQHFTRNFGHVILKIKMDDFENTKLFIEKTMKAVVPLAPYEVRFMEDSYIALYEEERRLGKAFNIFTLLALFIAGMGLFGLVSFQVLQRTKEIGIRKVLGSSITGIVTLLVKDFLRLVIMALLIATPIAYYFMYNWLQGYAYSIDIEWWVFVLVGFLACGVAFATISFQSIKAARSNPIKSLKTE